MISLKESTNNIYAGQHWAKRKEYKDSVSGHAEKFCRLPEPIGRWPVSIRYRFIFETRPLDTLNCAYMAKCFEDAFRALAILPDDTPAYVAESIVEVIKSHPSKTFKGDKAAPKARDKAKEDTLEVYINPYEFKQSH